MHIHIHLHDSNAVEILSKLNLIIQNQNQMATDLTEITSRVEENGTVIGSAIVLLQGLKEKLDAAGTDPVKLKELSDALGQKNRDLADAIVANTPSEEDPPPPPEENES